MSSAGTLTPTPAQIERTVAEAEQRTLSERALVRSLRETARLQAERPPTVGEGEETPRRTLEPAVGGILASARRLTGEDVKKRNTNAMGSAGKTAGWQEEAWDLYDAIGEQRFLADTLAGRMAQAAFYVGKTDPAHSPGTRPQPVENDRFQGILDAIGDGPSGFSQIINRLGINLFNVGEGWLVGIPPRLVPGTLEHTAAREAQDSGPILRTVDRSVVEPNDTDVLSMVWRMLSVDEISVDQSATAKFTLETGDKIECPVDDLLLIRIWRPHARRAWEPNSPTRAALPILRELLGLTLYVGAQTDSRLAGAGLLVISTEASAALKRAAGIPEDDPRDPLMEALTEAMSAAIKDRSSPAALVPITLTVPSDVVDKIQHITFSTPFDKETPKLRDEAIRRLALSQDAPPELLLGVAGMNHWGAWLVREDVVKTHLEPPLALICDALTTQYLRPILIADGMDEEAANEYVIWYDVDHLIERPNRGDDAKELYDRNELNGRALREATGFEETDAPDEPTITETDPAVETALRMVEKAPSLAQMPGLPTLVEDIRAVLAGPAATEARAEERSQEVEAPAVEIVEGERSSGDRSSEGGLPNTSPDDAPAGTPASGGGR